MNPSVTPWTPTPWKASLLIAGMSIMLPTCRRAADRSSRALPPNIVIIMADDLGANELGCYGNQVHQTPHLDTLAAEGMRFLTCWATPLCSPTRAEILTGRYGFRTGWVGLLDSRWNPSDHLDPDEFTFADALKPLGYQSILVGKWHLGGYPRNPEMILDSGFDEYCIWAGQGLPRGADHRGRQRFWNPALLQNGVHLPTTLRDYAPDIVRNVMIDFMRRNADHPFVAYYPMILPHAPYFKVPDPSDQLSLRAGSLKTYVEYMDHQVGEIVAAIDELGLRDRTYIMFLGDNGTANRGKGQMTERGVRVPLIVRGPEVKFPGTVNHGVVDLSDILPTVAELAGAKLPDELEIDGKSFAPLLRGETESVRDWVFSYLQDQQMLRDERWLLEGDNRFYDCGDHRDSSTGCRDVTEEPDTEAIKAMERFQRILTTLPAPQRPEVPGGQRRGPRNRDRNKGEV